MSSLSKHGSPEESMKDIAKPKDVQRVVKAFFKKVKKDDLLAVFFMDKSKEDWDQFIEVMNRFWENALFYSGGYYGNPMQRHSELSKQMQFEPEHYSRWLHLFDTTVDELYAGDHANLMKERARNIASIMQVKIS
jgi:hemoglobin